MGYFTLCAFSDDKKLAPCAVIEGVSDADAEAKALALRRDGSLIFVPAGYRFTLRRSSLTEVASYAAWMALKPGRSPAALDGALNPRGERMRLAFFEKLWRGEINPHRNAPKRLSSRT